MKWDDILNTLIELEKSTRYWNPEHSKLFLNN